jgi:hypothetical protein
VKDGDMRSIIKLRDLLSYRDWFVVCFATLSVRFQLQRPIILQGESHGTLDHDTPRPRHQLISLANLGLKKVYGMPWKEQLYRHFWLFFMWKLKKSRDQEKE